MTIAEIHGDQLEILIVTLIFKEDGILHSSITSITISPNEQVNGYGVVYVGTEPSALFRSENGETWTELKI